MHLLYIYIYTSICLYIRQLYIAHAKTMASTLAAVGNVSNIGVSKNRRSFPLAVFPFILHKYVLFKMDLWVTVRKRPVLPRGTPHFATPPFTWVCFQADRQQLALMHPARWFHEYWSSGIKLSFPCLQPTTNNSEEISNSIDWLFGPFWPLIDLWFVPINNFRKEQWPSPWQHSFDVFASAWSSLRWVAMGQRFFFWASVEPIQS